MNSELDVLITTTQTNSISVTWPVVRHLLLPRTPQLLFYSYGSIHSLVCLYNLDISKAEPALNFEIRSSFHCLSKQDQTSVYSRKARSYRKCKPTTRWKHGHNSTLMQVQMSRHIMQQWNKNVWILVVSIRATAHQHCKDPVSSTAPSNSGIENMSWDRLDSVTLSSVYYPLNWTISISFTFSNTPHLYRRSGGLDLSLVQLSTVYALEHYNCESSLEVYAGPIMIL